MTGRLLPVWARLVLLMRSRLVPLVTLALSVFVLMCLFLMSGSAVSDLLGSYIGIMILAFNVLLAAELVAPEMNGGAALLWLQRPVSPVRHYLRHLPMAMAVALGISCTVVLATVIVDAQIGTALMDGELLNLPAYCLSGIVAACVCFGVSGWLPRGNALIALAVVFVGGAIDNEMHIRGNVFGPVVSPVLRALSYPGESIGDIRVHLFDDPAALWLPFVRVVLYSSAWVAVGCLGIRRLTAKKGLLY